MSEAYLGSGGRLDGGPARELIDAGYRYETAAGPRLAHGLSTSDIAHVVALTEAEAIPADQARALLAALLELDAIPGDVFPWNPALGDAFNSREAELARIAGAEAAGWLSAGRPRREAFRVALRLVARDGTRDLHDACIALASAVVDVADRHATDLAADYTYLQPAQPTRLGHLVLAYAYPLLRDAERLHGVHDVLDSSVAGAGGSAGSRWPLDRTVLAGLLGAVGVVPHAKDAIWQWDAYVTLAAAAATTAAHQSEMAQDLEILASQEFGIATLADEHSRASALMPQKRNPYALAVVRATAGTVAGDLTGMLVTLHTGSARTDHFHVLNGVIPRMLEEVVASTRLMAAVVARMTLNATRAGEAARRGFITAADLADVLAQSAGLDYRTAHHVVGRAVKMLVDSGHDESALTAAVLATAALASDGIELVVDEALVAEALDPDSAADTRLQSGSSAPGETEAMVAACREAITSARTWSDEATARATTAHEALRIRARALAES
ncbi:MAG: argininosuccinate lyase [Thermoleophilia bacterium]|nr:argininosuccinate lyase [Thermoleophilia bacterium]